MAAASSPRRAAAAAVAAAVLMIRRADSVPNGLGQKPGIGWNSDYCIGCIGLGGFQNEDYIKHDIADFIHSSGLQELGYTYINMDASWDLATRDANGDLTPDPKLWPSGMKNTVDYVHGLGLGFGLYGDRGTLDCAKNPGQLGHETQDAQFFARNEVDWFKSDSCYATGNSSEAFSQYATMRDALNATGRPIWFALCGWLPMYAPVGQTLGNSWRIGADTGGGWGPVMSNVASALSLGQFAGPRPGGGGWNDLSLLLLPGMGNGANLMSNERHRSQFNLHCIFAANMLMTGNMSAASPYVLSTWGNAEAVAVNQDEGYVPFVQLPHSVRLGESVYIQAHMAECGGEPALQNWTFTQPGFPPSFVFNAASDQCLNVEACASTIIYDGCVTSGGTCSGPGTFKNEQFELTAEGALVSLLEPAGTHCATVAANLTLSLAPCSSPPGDDQTFSYVAATGELQSKGGLCLTAPGAGPPSNISSLLVGRAMRDGSWALLALNNAAANATITCGADCFAAMGFAASDEVVVRDLYAHADVNTTLAGGGLDVLVGASGASTFLRLRRSVAA